MHLRTRNVNTAFRDLVHLFATHECHTREFNVVKRPSRNGPVLMIDEPATVTYTHPRERVLFNAARDANPFFHMYEALWMLAGRNDVAPVAYYASNMANYSDDSRTLNGAYGYRWRRAVNANICYEDERTEKLCSYPEPVRVDQLDVIVDHLKADPHSRRAVLAMWNVEDDLLKIGGLSRVPCPVCKGISNGGPCRGCGAFGTVPVPGSKDVCCNLSVMFSVRKTPGWSDPSEEDGEVFNPSTGKYEGEPVYHPGKTFIDMTVISRSEDLVWGLLGADYVDFTILQEYMAARLGAEVGLYHHFTNNLHAYESNWKPEEWLADRQWDWYSYEGGVVRESGKPMNEAIVPLVRDPEAFERELPLFVEAFSGNDPNRRTFINYTEPFFVDVAVPMMTAFYFYKSGRAKAAIEANVCRDIKADDWRIAATAWLERRVKCR